MKVHVISFDNRCYVSKSLFMSIFLLLFFYRLGKVSYKTPVARRSILDATPRTPTPFKNALAEFEKNGGVSLLVRFNSVLFIVILEIGNIIVISF